MAITLKPPETALNTAASQKRAERLAGKKVLVTGASGFIGSHLVETLLNLGAEVAVIAPTPGWRSNFVEPVTQKRIRLFTRKQFWNLSYAEQMELNSHGLEYVIHLAHVMPHGKTLGDKIIDDIRQNVLGTAQFVRQLPTSISRICFASSVMVYGNKPQLPVSESDHAHPATPYAAGKLAAESYLKLFAREAGAALSILRYSTVYGPFELVPRAIPNFIRRVLAGEPPVISGEGDDVRDYVHVSDVVEATCLALTHGSKFIDIFNIGTGIGYSTNEIAEKVIRLSGKEMTPVHIGANHVPVEIVCDISHARTVLGYRPKVQIDRGIEEEINFFESNPIYWRTS